MACLASVYGHNPNNIKSFLRNLLGILDQQAPYEFLGQLTGVAEVFLVKVVVDGGDVGKGLLLGLAQEW